MPYSCEFKVILLANSSLQGTRQEQGAVASSLKVSRVGLLRAAVLVEET